MINKLIFLLLLGGLLPIMGQGQDMALTWQESEDGWLLKEGSAPRLFYQTTTKAQDGKYPRANYIHPLYGIDGEELTEDFPADHLHHRGIFWTWHQLYVDGERVADPWISEGISWEVVEVKPLDVSEGAGLMAKVLWSTEQGPVVEEHLALLYERLEEDAYRLTTEVELKPLKEEVSIGGSEDPKGYGGFSPRIKLSENVGFFDEEGEVAPRELPVSAGPWMNVTKEKEGDPGVVIMGEPDELPDYKGWILRAKNSMQNMAFPGREPIVLPDEAPYLSFRNQLLVHQGLDKEEIERYYQNFKVAGSLIVR
ncbi:DUF6807 family protein [Pleomorphovibrio marinus]|uniref:DUF6807 family protein n=1 Tax=Pleomorphovibrio marinus TaxID=2164132 RepID=UPI001E59D705|nr:DUF6807 family protein [Pleomorphovibrio marinus]